MKIDILFREKLSFLLVGLVSASTHLSVLYLSFRVAMWPLVLSTVLGYLASLAISYYLNYRLTFQSKEAVIISGAKYFITTLIGLAWNVSLMTVLVNIYDVHYLIAFLLMSLVVMVNNYLLSKYWVF